MKKRVLDNLKAHYSVLKKNVQEESELLSRIVEKRKKEEEALFEIRSDIAIQKQSLDVVRNEIKSAVLSYKIEVEKLDKDKDLTIRTLKQVEIRTLEELKKLKKKISDNKKEITSIQKTRILLENDIEKLGKKREAELKKCAKIENEYVVWGTKVAEAKKKKEELDAKLLELRNYVAEEQKKFSLLQGISEKQQLAISGHEENIRNMDERLEKKRKELEVLEARVRNLYKQIGMPLKKWDI